MRTLRAVFMEGDATAAPLMRIAILICEVDRVLAQMDRHDRVGLFTVEPDLHGALDAAKVRRVSSAAERQHKCGGKAEGHRAAKNTGFSGGHRIQTPCLFCTALSTRLASHRLHRPDF